MRPHADRRPALSTRRFAAAAAALPLLLAVVLGVAVSGCRDAGIAEAGTWHCPMHPTYISDRPGACPICGMDLVPVAADDPAGAAPAPATVEASEAGIRLAGVRTAPAVRGRVTRTTRTVGLVMPDERRVRHVHTKIAGWVEQLHVNFTGQEVRAGQPILALYSPELLASQEEYLRARRAAARFAASTIPEVRRGGEDLVASARRRLELFDVPRGFIESLEASGEARRAVTLVAPASGFVTTKNVLEGMAVEPGTELFTLTDLSHVWVEAEYYESEARLLGLGQAVEVALPYDPGHARRAEITYIYPTLSPESRTLKVRLELDNPGGDLRPGMFVDVTAGLESGEGVTVPEDAVIDTGLRRMVFVERAAGVFEPRDVGVGVRGAGRALVSSGLAEGERVAIRANFLLDSESKLRAALQAVRPALESDAAGAPPAPAPPHHAH